MSKLKHIVDETFKDLNFTIYHITSAVFILMFIFFYVIFYSFEVEFILNKNKYYMKHTDFNWSDENGDDYKTTDDKFKSITSKGKRRILLFSFIFAVAVTFVVHIVSMLLV